jgi:hypothetical protein
MAVLWAAWRWLADAVDPDGPALARLNDAITHNRTAEVRALLGLLPADGAAAAAPAPASAAAPPAPAGAVGAGGGGAEGDGEEDDADAEADGGAGAAVIPVRAEPHPLINRADRWGMTPLVTAVSGLSGPVRLGIFRLLLAAGADVNAVRPGPGAISFASAFLAAVASGRQSVVELLLAHGANVRVRNPVTGGCALHEAARGGRTNADLIVRLLGLGLPVDDVDARGNTPLIMAAGHEYELGIVAALLAAGADVHARNEEGTMPLHAAAYCGAAGTVRTLLAAGADPTARDAAGRTAAEVAAVGAYVEDQPMETWEEARAAVRASVLAALAGLPEEEE